MPAIIAAIGAVLVTLLRVWAVSIIGRILVTMGLGLYAYNVAVPQLMAWVESQFIALPDFVKQSVGYAGVDVVCTMVLSALAVRAAARVFMGKAP